MLQEDGHIKNIYRCLGFLANSLFTFDDFWGSLGYSIFEKSRSDANNTRSRLPLRLPFRFL